MVGELMRGGEKTAIGLLKKIVGLTKKKRKWILKLFFFVVVLVLEGK